MSDPAARPKSRTARGLFIASGVLLGIAILLTAVIGAAAANQDTDSERQEIGFFLTVAVLPCGLAMLLLGVAVIVLIAERGRPR